MVLTLAVPVLGQTGTGSSDSQALAILEAAAERFGALETFCARFDQQVDNDILRQTIRSHGELCQARPDRFAMLFEDPEGDRVIADGESIWLYFPSADPGQVFRSSLAESGGRFDLHREFLNEPGERYAPTLEGRETVNGTSTHRLALEPLRPSPYIRARVWIGTDDRMVHRVEITEDDGLVRTLSLSDMRMNPQVPVSTFEFEPPEGAQVIVR